MALRTILIASVVLFGVLLSLAASGEEELQEGNEYCNVWCTRNGRRKHVMCQFPDRERSKSCRHYEKRALLTEFEKDNIVKLHNAYRLKVAEGRVPGFPAALNLKTMRWDLELEEIMSRWTEQCIVISKMPWCFNSRDGTNNSVVWTAMKLWNDSIHTWEFDPEGHMKLVQMYFNDYKNFPVENITHYNGGPGRNLFYIMRAETERIGCSRSRFMYTVNGKDEMYTLFGCIYNGNASNGRAMYEFVGDGREANRGLSLPPLGAALVAVWLGTCLLRAVLLPTAL